MQVHEAIALDSIQAIAASFGSTFDAEKIIDTVVEKVAKNVAKRIMIF